MPLRKVRIVQPLAGKDFTYQAGEEVDLPAQLAEVWTERGLAEYVEKTEGVKPSAPPAKRARKATSKKQPEKR